MMEPAVWARKALAEHYDLHVLRLARIHQGHGTQNWLATTDAGRFFLKQYPADANWADEDEALRLGEHSRVHGVPVPAVRQTRAGRLLCAGPGPVFALFDYIADADSGGPVSADRMVRAGEALGQLHRLFRDYPRPGDDEAAEWLAFDLERKRSEVDHYLSETRAKPRPDPFDVRSEPVLVRRKELLPVAARILEWLPALTSQVVHGDFSPPNLLFRGPMVAGVVDFRPPRPFLVAYELGRIALSPENLARPDWRAGAAALVDAYCSAHDAPPEDVRCAPRVWLAQLIRSTYGVREHYTRPAPFQRELDEFWFRRAEAAEVILRHLDELEEMFGRRGRT